MLPNLQDYQEVLVANCPKTRPWCCDELKEDMCDRIALMVEIHPTPAPSRTKELRARSLSGKFYPQIAFSSLIHTFAGEIRCFSRCGVVSQSWARPCKKPHPAWCHDSCQVSRGRLSCRGRAVCPDSSVLVGTPSTRCLSKLTFKSDLNF